jgi:hypothetical protein
MTVQELIQNLQKLPPQAKVWLVYDGGLGASPVVSVRGGERIAYILETPPEYLQCRPKVWGA